MEIQGGMSIKSIERHFEKFRKEAEVNDRKEVEIILPTGSDPRISKRLIEKTKPKG